MGQRYANKTKVSTDRSELQLKALLRRYGADAIMTYEERRKGVAAVAFCKDGRNVRLTLPLPSPDEFSLTETGRERSEAAALNQWEQACRARWRLLLLLVKAKLEAIEADVSTFEREFLADIMLPDGSTFHEAVQRGRVDKLLGPADGSAPLLPPPSEDP